jgi:hypothetical protein
MRWVRAGVEFVISRDILSLLTWEDVETRACGPKVIETEALRKITRSNVDMNDKIVLMFFDMFETFT